MPCHASAVQVIFIFVASTFIAFGLAYYVFPLWATLALTAVMAGLAVYAAHTAHHIPVGAVVDKGASTR